jgi:hypothetical protein
MSTARMSQASAKQSAMSCEGPFVQVHVGMEAAALFVTRRTFPGQGMSVERAGGFGKEPKCIEMRAAETVAFNNPGQRLGRNPEWPASVADLFGRLAVDHRPFV